jgi:chromosome segregation ATPase
LGIVSKFRVPNLPTSQLLAIKDQEILKKDEERKQKNLELETCHLQIKNMDDLRRIVELEYERNELLKRVEARDNHIEILESTVQNHETTIQKHSEAIENLKNALSPLVTLQHSLQIATEANLKAIEHIFPGGSSAPYYFKSVVQLKKILNGDEESASAEAFEAWDLKPSGDQEEVQRKLKVFLQKYKSFIYYTKLLKNANTLCVHTIVGGTREYSESVPDGDAVKAINYCNKVKAEL